LGAIRLWPSSSQSAGRSPKPRGERNRELGEEASLAAAITSGRCGLETWNTISFGLPVGWRGGTSPVSA
jgi:hypothetical protein